jgi:alpha-beta hydrolase superfamily lysophospholipase
MAKVEERLNLSEINLPTLTIYSETDQVVSSSEIYRTFERVGSPKKELVAFDSSAEKFGHILAGEIVSPGTVAPIRKLIVEFLQQVLP